MDWGILQKSKSGNKDAEKELFEFLSVRFFCFAKRKIWNKDDAKDVAQETCKTIFERYKQEDFADFNGFLGWAYGVFKYKVLDYISRLKRSKGIDSARNEETEGLDLEEKRLLIISIIDCLKKIYKKYPQNNYVEVMNLIIKGHKTEKISHLLGLTENNIYQILFRTRKVLKSCLETGRV